MIPICDVSIDELKVGKQVVSMIGNNGHITKITENTYFVDFEEKYIVEITWETGNVSNYFPANLTKVMLLERFDMIEFVNNSLIIDKRRYKQFIGKNEDLSSIACFDLVAVIDGDQVKVIKSRYFPVTMDVISFVEFKKLCDKHIK